MDKNFGDAADAISNKDFAKFQDAINIAMTNRIAKKIVEKIDETNEFLFIK